MKNNFLRLSLVLLLLSFPVFVFAQSLDEKLKEIDVYAEKARADWNAPGMLSRPALLPSRLMKKARRTN